MDIIEKINNNKYFIISELYEWAETFIGEYDEEGEKTLEPYNFIYDLAVRLEKNICNEKDYETIIFIIEQMNYNTIKIKL